MMEMSDVLYVKNKYFGCDKQTFRMYNSDVSYALISHETFRINLNIYHTKRPVVTMNNLESTARISRRSRAGPTGCCRVLEFATREVVAVWVVAPVEGMRASTGSRVPLHHRLR